MSGELQIWRFVDVGHMTHDYVIMLVLRDTWVTGILSLVLLGYPLPR